MLWHARKLLTSEALALFLDLLKVHLNLIVLNKLQLTNSW